MSREQSAAAGEEPPAIDLPFVTHVDGEVSANGGAIALRIARGGQPPIDICLRADDVQYMVGILLALSCEAKRLQPHGNDTPPKRALPLPLNAINIGQDDNNDTFLMVEVGGAALMFGMPPSCLKEIGQTLLALSADHSATPS
jgi:hypothetical protein